MTNSIQDIAEESQCIFIIGSNTTEQHPVIGTKIRRAKRHRGAKLIVADTRYTATMAKADLALRIRPGSGNLFGLYLLKHLLEEGLEDPTAIDAGFDPPQNWRESFDRMPWGHAGLLAAIAAGLVGLSILLFRWRDLRRVG